MTSLTFATDGRSVLLGDYWTVSAMEVPAAAHEGPAEQVVLWAQLSSPRDLDAAGVTGWQTMATWQERRQRQGADDDLHRRGVQPDHAADQEHRPQRLVAPACMASQPINGRLPVLSMYLWEDSPAARVAANAGRNNASGGGEGFANPGDQSARSR